MAIQLVNLGDGVNSGTGDSVRNAFQKVNDNFVEIYGNTAPHLFSYGALTSIINNHSSEFGNLIAGIPNSIDYQNLLNVLTANTGSFAGFVSGIGVTANYLNTGTSLSTAQFEQVLAIVASSTTSLALQLDTLGTAFETANTQAASNYTHLVGLISSSTASVATKISNLETGFTAVNGQLVNINGSLTNVLTVVNTKANIIDVANAISNSTASIATKVQGLETGFTQLNGTVNGLTTTIQTKASIADLQTAVSNANGSIANVQNLMNTQYSNLASTVTSNYNNLITLVSNSTTSLASRITTLDTNFHDYQTAAAASYTNLVSLVSDSTASLASSVQGLQTNFSNLESTVTSNYNSLVNLVSNSATSLASKIDTLDTAFQSYQTSATASYTNLVHLVSDSTASLATSVQGLQTNFSNLESTVTSNYNSLVNLISNSATSLASKIDTLDTNFQSYQTSATASYTNLVNLVSDSTASLATSVQGLETNFSNLESTVTSNYNSLVTLISNSATSLASSIDTLDTAFQSYQTSATASYTNLVNLISNSSTSLATQIDALQTNFNNYQTSATASYTNLVNLVSNSTASIASQVNSLQTNFTNLETSVTNFNTYTQQVVSISNSFTSVVSAITQLRADYNSLVTGTQATIAFVQDSVANSTASIATQLNTLQTNFTNYQTSATASYTNLLNVITNSTGSLATRTSNLETGYTNVNSTLTNINNSLTNAGNWINLTNNAAITSLQTAISNSTGSLATSVSGLQTNYTGILGTLTNINNSLTNLNTTIGTKASISYVDSAVSNSTGSFATRTSALETNYTGILGTLTNIGNTLTNINNSLTNLNTTLGTKATITYVDNAVSNSTGSFATRTSALETNYTGILGTLTNINNSLTNLNTTIGTKASITYVDNAVSNSTGSFATRTSALETAYTGVLTTLTNHTSSLTNINNTLTNINSSLTNAYTAISSKASITYVDNAVSNSTGSFASSIQTLTSNYSGMSATIQTQASTINGLTATYSLTVNTNGAISGYKLNSTGGTSTFTVMADNFKLYTAGGTLTPFSVTGSTVTMQNVVISGSLLLAGSVTPTQIDSRGLSIKDANGNVILAAGTALNYSNITANPGWLNSNLSLTGAGVLSSQGTTIGTITSLDPTQLAQTGNNSIFPTTWITAGATWTGGGTSLYANVPTGQALSANGSSLTQHSIITSTSPDGAQRLMYRAVSSTQGNAQGGWDSTINVNASKAYRYSLWIRVTANASGSYYHGCTNVNDIGGSANSNPYFVTGGQSGLTLNRWYLLVGYVYPHNWAGGQLNQSGIYDGTNGSKVANGTDYQWSNSSVTTCSFRSYQYYTNSSGGSTQDFFAPKVYVLDGTEPDIKQLLAGGLIATAGTTANWSSINSTPANLSGLTGTENIKNSQISVSGGNISGIGTGDGTAVANSSITVSGGTINGIGTGNGTAVANSAISISGGAISGIGTGDGTAVANSSITVNASGVLSGIGTSNVVVDNTQVQVGGTNILLNSGRFTSTTNWFDNGSGLQVDSTVTYGGFNTMKLLGNASGGVGTAVVRVRPNTIYTVSALVKASAAIASAGYDSQLHIQNWTDENTGDVHQETAISSDNSITTSWRVIQQTFRTASSANAGYVRFYLYPLAAGVTVNVAWVKLEQGNKATDWTPNPEEVRNTNISISGGAISGIGTGDGTAVANSSISVSGGTINGIGTGNGTAVANSSITVDGAGAIQGIGSGAGTAVSNSKITVDSGGAIQGIGTGNGTAVSNTLVTTISLGTTNATQSGNTITKTAGTNGAWDCQGYSIESYTNGAFCSFRADTTGGYIMAGLNTDPTTDASYSSIDYAIYLNSSGSLLIYESGSQIGSYGSYSVGDIMSVTYDGSNIRYYKNGSLLRTVAVSITNPLYFDSSMYYTGNSISQIKFGPMSSNNWNQITNQPAGIYNSNISVSGGTINGIGTGNGTAVANSAISISSAGVLSGAGGGTVTLNGMGQNTYRVVAKGLSQSTGPTESGLYVNGTNVYGMARSYSMVRIRRSDGVVTHYNTYDVYGSTAAATSLATDLNNTDSASVVVVWTYDEPQNNRTAGGLPAAIYRCGGSPGVFGSANFASRGAYILIGIGGCGQGNGYEMYHGSGANDIYAWCDTGFTLVNGMPNISGAQSQPYIDASNISTYIASAAIDSAYIKNLDASKINAGTINVGLNVQSPDGKFVIDFANKYINITI